MVSSDIELISRKPLTFTVYDWLQCLPVKLNYSNLKYALGLAMNTLMFETKFLLSQNSHVVLVGHSNLHLTHGSTQIRYVNLNDSSVNLFNDKWNIKLGSRLPDSLYFGLSSLKFKGKVVPVCRVHKASDLLLLFLGSILTRAQPILEDLGADSGGEGKSKQAEKYGTKKSKGRREEPLGTMSYQTSSKRSQPLWLLIGARKLLCFFCTNGTLNKSAALPHALFAPLSRLRKSYYNGNV